MRKAEQIDKKENDIDGGISRRVESVHAHNTSCRGGMEEAELTDVNAVHSGGAEPCHRERKEERGE